MLMKILAAYGLYHFTQLIKAGTRAIGSLTTFVKERAPAVQWLIELRAAVPDVTDEQKAAAKGHGMAVFGIPLTDEDAARYRLAKEQGLPVASHMPGGSRRDGTTTHFEAAPSEVDPGPLTGRDAAIRDIIASARQTATPAPEVLANAVDTLTDKAKDVAEVVSATVSKTRLAWNDHKDDIKAGSEEAVRKVTDTFEDLITESGRVARDAGLGLAHGWKTARSKIREAVSAYDCTEHGEDFDYYVWERVLPGVYRAHRIEVVVE